MRTENRWIAILVAVAGMGVCLVALVGFVLTVLQNNLPWHQSQSIREHYQAIGDSYSQGFTVGFFLCFFMTMIAVTISTFFGRREVDPLRSGQPQIDGGHRPSA
jgi:ABC-type Fe3+ transport system permease subunit